jgi:hypothetical protein
MKTPQAGGKSQAKNTGKNNMDAQESLNFAREVPSDPTSTAWQAAS